MGRTKYNQKLDELSSELILSIDDIKASSLLDFNIDEDKIIPYVIEAQDLYLEPMIGTAFMNALKNPNRTFEYDYLVSTHISKVLLHYALGVYIKKATYQVANGGVFKHFSEDSEVVGVGEVRVLAKEEFDKAETYGTRMINFLETYKDQYPEYTQSVADGISARRQVGFLGGWVLDNNYDTGQCGGGIVKDADFFDVVFYEGNNNQTAMGFDPSTLNQYNTLPNSVWAEPQDNYYWMVSDTDFIITMFGVPVPLAAFGTGADQETYVKGEQDGLFWIRITIAQTYEQAVQFNIKKV